jgi:parallel beta-helix repeat protein
MKKVFILLLSVVVLSSCGSKEKKKDYNVTIKGTSVNVSNAVDQIKDETRIDLATVAGDSSYHHIITQPGSYYLTHNLEVTKSNGISISSSGVTLDLNGFEISRISGTGGSGIYINAGMDRASVRNGTIAGEFRYGIYSSSSPRIARGCLFKDLAVSGCSSYGIYAGDGARLENCQTHDNQGTVSIYAGVGSSLDGCTANHNLSLYAIFASRGSSLTDCSASDNQGYGIYAENGSNLHGCAAYNNEGDYGIHTGEGSSLSGCTARNNQTNGIYTGVGSTLDGCTAIRNKGNFGIRVESGSNLRGCTAYGNTGTGSLSYGIFADQGSSVVGCTARYNSNTNSPSTSSHGIGIFVNDDSLVKDCIVSNNRGDGIRVSADSSVIGNTCYRNGTGDGAGIRVKHQDNRIEGNTLTHNNYGIKVDTHSNFITRNTASGNDSNWEIAAGNICLVVVGTTGSSISGDSGGTAPGSTDPNANFTY